MEQVFVRCKNAKSLFISIVENNIGWPFNKNINVSVIYFYWLG